MNEEWLASKLHSVADVRVSSVDKKFYPTETPVRLCNYMDVYAHDYLTAAMEFMDASASKDEIERFGLMAGDVVITKDSESPDDIGVAAVIAEQISGLVCGYHLALIRPRNGEIDSIYLAKQLRSWPSIKYFAANAGGSTRFGLSIGAIGNLEIPLAPRPEQTKIGEVLATVDAAIEDTEAFIAKQQRIKTGLMQDILNGGIDEHGNLRSEQTHEFKDSSLGRIPKEWDVFTVGLLADHVGSGVTPRGGESVYTSEGVLFIRSQNVHFGELRLDDVAYIPERIHLSMRRSEVYENDVLLNITGASIGRCCRMPHLSGRANVNQHVCAIRLNEGTEASAGLLAAVLESSIGQHQIAQFNAGGNREGLNYQQVRNFLIPCPVENAERERLYELIRQSGRYLVSCARALQKLQLLKTGLMQELLPGKRRVTALLPQAGVASA